MKIYHGTSEAAWNQIRTTGLVPRTSERASNWEHFPSSSDLIYLTRAYAPYFGICAVESLQEDRVAVLELEFSDLEVENLRPDEDFVGQSLSQQHRIPLEEATEQARSRSDELASLWEQSLEQLGQVGYKDVVPVGLIQRVALFEPQARPDLVQFFVDPTITPLNYQFCQGKYLALTRWLMGDDFDPEEWWEWKVFPEDQQQALLEIFSDRTGIEQIVPQR